MTSDYKKKYTDLVNYIPNTYRSVASTSLLRNLHNKFLTKEESIPMLGYVGDKIANDNSPYVAAANLDRELNALVPSVYTKLGSEDYIFTFSDILQKLKLLGVDTNDFGTWGRATSFNFAPPIDLDKFSNYSRYRWYGHLLGLSHSYNTKMDPEYYVIQKDGVSDWATNNFWVHEQDANQFFADQGYDFTINNTIAAIRPIIEYKSFLEQEMILHVSNGQPSATGTVIDQTVANYKTEFNQKPLFNLYLLDGSHAGLVSPIFYYAEGNEYPVDSSLKTRIQKDAFGDFTFEQGLVTNDGLRILFYKKSGVLNSIWEQGPDESPVYYVKDQTGTLVPTDPATDTAGVGAWKFPSQMFYNPTHEARKTIGYGDLIGHFTSIIGSQNGFVGNPFGANNFRTISNYNLGLGGHIKDYNTNFSLFLGLINQLDSSIPGIIEFGKLQYAQMLSAIGEYVTKNIANNITDGTISVPNAEYSNDVDPTLLPMYESFLTFVTSRNDSAVFSDTTSSIAGWPATLPYLGLAPATRPVIFFDKVIGTLVLKHHDGHYTILSEDTLNISKDIANISFLRSDGQTTPGVAGFLPPSRPYKNQFWFDANTNKLKTYSLISDTVPKFPASNGDYYYDRINDVLYVYNSSISNYEVVGNKMVAWKEVNLATIISQITLMTERDLFDKCPLESTKIDPHAVILANGNKAQDYLAHEFAIFAAKHGLDISAGDYSPSNAFTWNYTNAVISGIPSGTNIARWYSIYNAYFGTTRPNLQPWILQGYTSQPAWWVGMYGDTTGTRIWTTQMWADIVNDTTPGHPAPTGPWTKKLCVNVTTDDLLPPYVSSQSSDAANALINTIPSGIANGYLFGDNGPAEMTWRVSLDCTYDKLKVCFRLDPINFVNTTWGYNNIKVNGYEIDRQAHRKLSHHDFILHGETPSSKFTGYSFSGITQDLSDTTDTLWTLTCVGNTSSGGIFSVMGNASGIVSRAYQCNTEFISAEIRFTLFDHATDFNVGDKLLLAMPSQTVTYVPTIYSKFIGINQWFVNLNRYNSIDMSIALADHIFRQWDLKLGHRMSGLINTELFDVNTDQFALHSNDYSLIIKENKNIADFWLDAIRVQLIRRGDTNFVNGVNVPLNKGADWVFRIETFNKNNPSIQYYEYDTNGSYLTFNAFEKSNSKDEWKHLKTRTNLRTRSTPFLVTGIENVANVIFGYVDKLNEDGWRFNIGQDPQVDERTGRVINWQMYIESFINQQYLGVEVGSGIILNPFATTVWFETPHGFVSNLRNKTFADITASQAIFDSFGNSINMKDLQIFRNDDVTQIQSNVIIGGIHLLLDEYEHIALFENYTYDKSRGKLIYDPFLGVRVNRLYVSGERSTTFNGRLSFGGHYIKDYKVKRNLEASITDILNYYDVDKMIDKSETAKHARALLGYESKQYMTDLGLPDKSQFGFWRGLISNKGSNMSVDAFLNSSRFESAKLDEFWAYKLASYGDARQLSYPEIKLSAADAQHNYTKIQFVANASDPGLVGFININPYDETRWVSPGDMSTTNITFAAEMIGETKFEGIWPGMILDLEQNGKPIFADSVQVFEQVYLKTGDMSPFLIRVFNFNLVNSSTIQFTSDMSIDLNTYALSAPRKFTVKCFGPSQPKFNPAKLIDYKNKVIVSDLALWDPARGSHTAEALEIVDMITPNDPSKYNYSVRTINNINYDPYRPWDNKDVGRVWWNTKNLSYIPYSDVNIFPARDVRLSYWGALADWSSIELYEWTESSAPPSAYADLVKTQEGDSSIDINVRASGNVAVSELYSRNRTWRQRPIAWGYTDTPGSVAPALESIGEYRVGISTDLKGNSIAILSSNDWVSAFPDVALNMKISGGLFHYNTTDISDVDNFKLSKPYGEAIVSGLNQGIAIGSSSSLTASAFVPPASPALIKNLAISKYDLTAFSNALIGQIVFEKLSSPVSIVATNINTNITQTVVVGDVANTTDAIFTLVFDTLGFSITGQTIHDWSNTDFNTTNLRENAIADSICNGSTDVHIRAALPIDITIPFGTNILPSKADADLTLGDYQGWVLYREPTAAELAADTIAPNNMWQQYYGDWNEIPQLTASLLTRIKTDRSSPLTLSNGTSVPKFDYVWNDWLLIEDTFKQKKYDGGYDTVVSSTSFTFENEISIPTNRLSVYLNGVYQPLTNIVITKNVVECSGLNPKLGDTITVILKAYAPSSTELSFNPDANPATDNPIQLKQYKYDYQYTVREIRDSSGTLVNTLYYFWVANKNLSTNGRAMSVQSAKNLLKVNNNPYAILQNISEIAQPNVPSYNQFIGVGLSRYITEDDTYKIRFTRDFILRDDPHNIELKNIHTEWAMIREQQNTLIPEQLWNILVDAACGVNIVGDAIPSLSRVAYDDRNGTNTRYGFEAGQAFVDKDLAVSSIKYAILNTALTIQSAANGGIEVPDPIEFIDPTTVDALFATPTSTRKIMNDIWTKAKPKQVNEIFFTVLYDALAENYEFSDIFKTSMIAAHSIRLFSSLGLQ